MSVIPATMTDVEVEALAAIEAEAEVVIEVAHIGPTTAISIARDGRHLARPALGLTLLMN